MLEKSETIEVQFSGSGGQGLILAAITLASAAVAEGYQVIQTQSYGPEARGGASRADLLIGKEKIYYPHVEKPDIFLALTQQSCDKYLSSVKEKGVAFLDSLFVKTVPETFANVIKLPVIQTARDELGNEMVANILALGAINSVTNICSWSFLEKAVLERVPPKYAELNIKALALGKNLV